MNDPPKEAGGKSKQPCSIAARDSIEGGSSLSPHFDPSTRATGRGLIRAGEIPLDPFFHRSEKPSMENLMAA